MLGYKDKTFCPFYESCEHGEGCSRALTDEVRKAAAEFGLGVYEWAGKPKCHEEADDAGSD